MPITAFGTSITVSTQGKAPLNVGKLTSIGIIEPEIEELDTTTLLSTGGWHECMPISRSAGEVTLNGFFDATDAGQTALCQAFDSGEMLSCAINYVDGTTLTFAAFVKKYSIGAAETGGAVGFGATLRITGAISVTREE